MVGKNTFKLQELALGKAAEVPGFNEDLGHYAMYVPEYGEMERTIPEGEKIIYPRSNRAAEELSALAFTKAGEALGDAQVKANVELFRLRARSKLGQLLGNQTWLAALESHEIEEDVRLDKEQALASTVGIPNNLRRLMRGRFEASLPAKFQAAPRTRTKLAEEMLVHPTERLIYERKEGQSFAEEIGGLVIDPLYISDTLLINLGLEDYLPVNQEKVAAQKAGRAARKKLSRYEKVAFREKAIPEIKAKLGELKTVKLDHEINRPDERYLRTFTTNDGYIVGTTHTVRGKQLFRANLIDAANRIGHIDENHVAEIAKLRKIRDTIRDIDFKVANDWQKVKGGEELGKIKSELAKMVDSLKLVNNKLKVEMLELLADCVTLESTFTRQVMVEGKKTTETAVRLNPGAKRAKWNRVPEKIGQRIEEISAIESYLAKDRVRLESLKVEHRLIPFGELYKYVEDKAAAKKAERKVRNEQEQLSGEKVTEAQVVGEAEKVELMDKLADWKMEFDSAKRGAMLEPYRSFAKKVYIKITDAEKVLSENAPSRKTVAIAVTQVYLAAKLQVFWDRLQNIYDKFLACESLPFFVQLRDEVGQLKAMLRGKRVAEGLRTVEFDDTYHQFYGLLDRLIEKAEEGKLATKARDYDLARHIKGEMYKEVASVDIVKVVGQIE